MSTRVRFAPSPTGYLHVGNVRTALINWLFARHSGGEFLLRIDDTDSERSRPEYEQAISEDMQWLGLNWDVQARQSDRFERYHAAIGRLRASGRLYACYETPDELDIQRKMLASRGMPPIYNRAGLRLSDAERSAYEAEGRTPHWRFMLNAEDIRWDDLVRGPTHMGSTHVSDPVLIRADGVPVYTLASVVDDGELNITHVIRGEDHVSNTAVQVQLFQALGFALPQFAHLALLKTKEGELSKRLGGNDIRALRQRGILPQTLTAFLARLGTSDPIQPVEMDALVQGFSFAKFSRAPAQYNEAELETLNAKFLHSLPYSAVQSALPDMAADMWESVRGNIRTLDEARQWRQIILQRPHHAAGDKDFLAQAAAALPPEPWQADVYDRWIAALKPLTPRKGKELFMPLRLALTGVEHGPELRALLPLLGYEEVKARLS